MQKQSGNNIAIIDDGVNEDILENVTGVCRRVYVSDELTVQEETEDYGKGVVSHGTECASILCAHSNTYKIISIRILNEKSKDCKIEKLLVALKWCLYQDIHICSLSLGTIDMEEGGRLKEIIAQLFQKGVIIVAAMSNEGKATYPANLTGVLRVREHPNFMIQGITMGDGKMFSPDFLASGLHRLSYRSGETYLVRGNSYAVPVVVAQIHNSLEGKWSGTSERMRIRLGCWKHLWQEHIDMIGTDRDRQHFLWDYEGYMKNLLQLPVKEVLKPVLAAIGENREEVADEFIHEMRNNGYVCVKIQIGEWKESHAAEFWFPDQDVFLKIWGRIEDYYEFDCAMISAEKLQNPLGKVYDGILREKEDIGKQVKKMLNKSI